MSDNDKKVVAMPGAKAPPEQTPSPPEPNEPLAAALAQLLELVKAGAIREMAAVYMNSDGSWGRMLPSRSNAPLTMQGALHAALSEHDRRHREDFPDTKQ
jgi:hypothetical protein